MCAARGARLFYSLNESYHWFALICGFNRPNASCNADIFILQSHWYNDSCNILPMKKKKERKRKKKLENERARQKGVILLTSITLGDFLVNSSFSTDDIQTLNNQRTKEKKLSQSIWIEAILFLFGGSWCFVRHIRKLTIHAKSAIRFRVNAREMSCTKQAKCWITQIVDF